MIESRRMWMKVDGNICGATCISDATILTYRAPPAMAGPCVGASKVGRWTRVVHLGDPAAPAAKWNTSIGPKLGC